MMYNLVSKTLRTRVVQDCKYKSTINAKSQIHTTELQRKLDDFAKENNINQLSEWYKFSYKVRSHHDVAHL